MRTIDCLRSVAIAVVLQAAAVSCGSSNDVAESAGTGGGGGSMGSGGTVTAGSGGAVIDGVGGATVIVDASSDGDAAFDVATKPDATDAAIDRGDASAANRPALGDLDSKGRKLVWAQEFDGPAIDRSIWGNEIGFVRNNELQNYTTDAKNQYVDNGDLVIKAIYEGDAGPADGGQGSYSSASLTTEGHAQFLYGRIEARIRMPAAKGAWPAFWMLPANKAKYDHLPPYDSWWPAGGEVDIVECVSQLPKRVHGTAHFLKGTQPANSGGTADLTQPVSSDYHVFAIEWTATRIDWFVDDKQYFSFDTSQPIDGRTPFQDPFYLILNLAIGGSWAEPPDSAPYPVQMRVDWVRVWQTPT
jgi:beta-glucanase (GH16 family)